MSTRGAPCRFRVLIALDFKSREWYAREILTVIDDRHSYDNEKKIALDAWARTLTHIIEQRDGATVVAFARS